MASFAGACPASVAVVSVKEYVFSTTGAWALVVLVPVAAGAVAGTARRWLGTAARRGSAPVVAAARGAFAGAERSFGTSSDGNATWGTASNGNGVVSCAIAGRRSAATSGVM